MARTTDNSHYLREWRQWAAEREGRKKFPLEDLAQRLKDECGYETTYATLSRTERGLIDYGQRLLEALAQLYGVTPSDLLRPPPSAGEPDNVIGIWERIPQDRRPLAKDVLRRFTEKE